MSLGNEILAVVTRGLLRAIDGRGIERSALLRAAGLSEQSLDPDAWLPISQHLRIGNAISEALPGQNLGLQTGAPIFADPRGALGYCLRQSGVHRRALENFGAYVATVNRTIRVRVAPEAPGIAVLLDMLPEMEAAAHPAEALFAAWLSISRHLTASAWHPLLVEFAHQPIGNTDEHRALFGCPVRFGCARNRLLISEADASLPILERSHEFAPLIQRAVEAAVARADEASKRGLVELSQRLRRVPLDVTALRGPEGEHLAGARLASSRALLDHSAGYVHEVVFLLGFEGMDAFEQAFVKRFGERPVDVRRLA